MITLYGAPMSSSGRSHWMLEETGVPYTYTRVDLRNPTARAEFLKVNPAGKIPFLVDGDLRLAESIAINFYLAERYRPELVPTGFRDRALAYQWSLWAITNLQPESLRIMAQTMFLPESDRSPRALAAARTEAQRCLSLLEESLSGPFLVGPTFSVADVNAGSVVNLALHTGQVASGPKIAAWMEALRARPAHLRAAQAG